MHSIYIRLFFLAVIAVLLPTGENFAQGKNPGKDTLFPLYTSYRPGHLRNYVFKEETNIQRIHSDNSTRDLKREITYYISQVAIGTPDNGFTTVHTTVDSMLYRFSEDGAMVEYNSMSPEKPNLKFLDLQYSTIPLNRTFEMVISPYGDIAQIKGEMVEWLRKYTSDEGKGILAPIQMFLWMDGISDNNLKHFGDITKRIVPNGEVTRDSVWERQVSFRMNNIDFSGSVRANLASAKNDVYRIEASADSLIAQPGETRLYGITELLNLNSGTGKATFSIELADNIVRRVEADASSVLNATIEKETFRDKISTHLSWTLTGQTQW